MILTSPDFVAYDPMPMRITCDGRGVSPSLGIAEVPDAARSLVLILDDPDAPRGTFVHWVVFNIDPSTDAIAEGEAPEGSVEGANSTGKRGYVPPCPPSGTHRYFFNLYALNAAPDLPGSITADQLMDRVKESVIDEAQLVGIYTRD